MPGSDDRLAADLAAAVANCTSHRSSSKQILEAIDERLDDLLYGYGGDGTLELTVAESTSARLTILGLVIWVDTQTLGPLEAQFNLGGDGSSVTALTVRAGDRRTAQRDAPAYPPSARTVQRIVATRPTVDEDWVYVIRHDFG